jgi:hypothetical protein
LGDPAGRPYGKPMYVLEDFRNEVMYG